MTKTVLDFIVIGAQKAGTTSLFKYLESHPEIYMPPDKECPFFSDDERFARGWSWFLSEFFPDPPQDRLWGKATPHYMIDARVPERIRRVLPNVKLIAVLRNPIERARSQYRMSVRRGIESRDFQQMVNDLLSSEALEAARQEPTETNGYLVNGEYSRILKKYYVCFPTDQILVCFTEELAQTPGDVLHGILDFLGVDPSFVPPDLGTVYHRGGTRQRLPWVDRLRKMAVVRRIWQMLLPENQRRRLRFWLDQWNVIPDAGQSPLPDDVRQRLIQHYRADVAALTDLIGKEAPWGEWVG